MEKKTLILVIMGPMGCGKTTVGRLLAGRLGWAFIDADDLHPMENVDRMRAGIPLNDEDRHPWLERLRDEMQDHLRRNKSLVLACSALKEAYRHIIGVDQISIITVYLKGSAELLRRRVVMREHPYMNRDLLQSQLDALEEPEGGLWVDIALDPEEIVQTILNSLEIIA